MLIFRCYRREAPAAVSCSAIQQYPWTWHEVCRKVDKLLLIRPKMDFAPAVHPHICKQASACRHRTLYIFTNCLNDILVLEMKLLLRRCLELLFASSSTTEADNAALCSIETEPVARQCRFRYWWKPKPTCFKRSRAPSPEDLSLQKPEECGTDRL